jgi:putative endonuclease
VAAHRQALGRAGEAAAETYLRALGYAILARNHRCAGGEVDLVARDGETLVFVEVKTRRSAAYGSPLEAVDGRKQGRLVRAARHFLGTRPGGGRAARFDVVGVVWRGAAAPEIVHVRDAFSAG